MPFKPVWQSKEYGGFLPYANEIAKTASYTVTVAENGTLYTNSGATGAITFTLPTVAPGLLYAFRCIADQNILVTSTAANIVTFNNAAATTIALQTVGSRIGGELIFRTNMAGTLWFQGTDSAAANAITIS